MTDRFRQEIPDVVRRIADRVPSMLAYWDKDMRCRFANRAYERWFGVDPEALVGRSIKELLGPELYALNEPHMIAALAGEERTFERVVPGPGGVQRDSLAQYLPDIVDGEVRGFVVQVTEITSVKATEAALRESEQKFRTLSESSPFGVYYADATGQRTWTNARWREIYGFDPDQGLGDAWISTLHPDDRDRVLSGWREMAANGSEFEMEFRIRRRDGQIRLLKTRARPVLSERGGASGFVGALEDITDRRDAEQRLRESERFLDRTGRIAGVGGWEVDLRSQKVTWSAHTRRIHEVDDGYSPAFLGSQRFYPPSAWSELDAAVQRALADGTPWDLELPFITARGRGLWVRNFGEVEFEAGVPARLVGAFQDITEHRRHRVELLREQALRLQSEEHGRELDRLLRERGEMLDVLAHEVRQPLNNASAALQGAAAILAGLHEEIAAFRLTRAQSVLAQVLASIDNTLAVASLLARPDPVRRNDTDIGTLLAVAIADIPPDERERIQVDRATTTRTASMDMSLMRLALRNLLSNALRHSEAGRPVIVRVSDSDDPLALVIDVADTGPGVAQEAIGRLFERGAAQMREQSAGAHGLGLGLYIVRRVMELHGGMAQLVANGPQGATFRLVVAQPLDD